MEYLEETNPSEPQSIGSPMLKIYWEKPARDKKNQGKNPLLSIQKLRNEPQAPSENRAASLRTLQLRRHRLPLRYPSLQLLPPLRHDFREAHGLLHALKIPQRRVVPRDLRLQ